jgi:hypothetical protein
MKKMAAAFGAAFLLLAILFAPIFRVGASPVYTSLYRIAVTGSLIDSTPIGATTPSTGAFTSLSSTSGALNGSIGSTTPGTGAFTTASASGGFTGNLTGNASTATALQSAPSTCTSPSVAKGIDVSGNCIAQTFAQTLSSSSGYTTLPGGLIEQWVLSADNPAGTRGAKSVSFPITFPNGLLSVTASPVLDTANTTTNWEGQAVYVQPVGASVSGCSVATGASGACLYFDSRSDASPDTGFFARVVAIGY